jgi:hypothetical protein
MKRALLASAVSAAVLGVAALAMVPSVTAKPAPAPAVTAAAVPDRVDNFQLTDQTRLAHELYYFKAAPAIVLMSQTNGSAVSQQSAAALQKIADTYKDKGVLFYMVNSNLGTTREQAAAEVAKIKTSIPVLMDETQLVGENLGVTREGEVFVIDPKTWKIAYHGPVAAGKDALTANAIDAVMAGQAVEKARVDVSAGKAISFPQRAKAASFSKISYTKEVAPILEAKCVTCHEKGGIGSFAMDSYEVVKGFAPMMRESVRAKRMPPYFPDPHIGHFKNNQGLTDAETQTLIHWIEAGAPRGEGDDVLKINAKVAPEWPESLGKPDVILDLPAFNVPAKGLVEYQNQYVDNPFKNDTWLRAIALKPGDRRAVHHVISDHRPDPTLPRPKIPGGSVGSYTPGAEPQIIADEAGAPVPGGGKLHFQMHYTTYGKATTDVTQVGFYTLKTPPKYIKRSTVIGDFAFMIPAGKQRHEEVAYQTFPADAYIYTMYPHAHYRGYHVELKAKTPDGKEEVLLSLPKYDFNWQRDYDPVQPILVKKGTKLIATWVYDNSTANKQLSKETKDADGSPLPSYTVNVTWGEQTYQDMMYFRVNYRWADETVDNVRNDLQQALMASGTIGALDDNADDLVQKDELKGPLAGLKAKFEQLDLDHNGGLDAKELAAAGIGRAMARSNKDVEVPDL